MMKRSCNVCKTLANRLNLQLISRGVSLIIIYNVIFRRRSVARHLLDQGRFATGSILYYLNLSWEHIMRDVWNRLIDWLYAYRVLKIVIFYCMLVLMTIGDVIINQISLKIVTGYVITNPSSINQWPKASSLFQSKFNWLQKSIHTSTSCVLWCTLHLSGRHGWHETQHIDDRSRSIRRISP